MDASAMPAPFVEHDGWYKSVLSSLTATTTGDAAPEHLYTYTHVMHGFSAVLTARQLAQLQGTSGHVSAFPETYARLHTTRTPAFLGLTAASGAWPASKLGADVIIGIVDTGVWPESASFSDAGITSPVPSRWKGACEAGAKFAPSMCNRKLIGARSFSKGLKQRGQKISSDDYDSPRDYMGHGSHTSSTAAGAAVAGAGYKGYANGTATGIAPAARVAVYKAVFAADTLESASTDVLAAMDAAVADGVDVMSLSLGFPETSYDTNVIAIGAFAAVSRGVFVACSAGNDGSDGYTVMNGAPWITTVGASTVDREFVATVTVGTKSVSGRSVYPALSGAGTTESASLYYGQGNKSSQRCEYGSLSRKEVSGKFVLCAAGDSVRQQMDEVQSNGGRGAIVAAADDASDLLQPTDYTTPLVLVTKSDGAAIAKYYAASAAKPTVSVRFGGTELGVKPAPAVAYFSARGPSQISPAILKPDVVAPGVDVLAAWVPNKEVMDLGKSKVFTDYMLVSGTSMSSPHIAGVAALLRSAHPDWTPAAIRSAMMTTAYVKDNADNVIASKLIGERQSSRPGTPLDFGSGHVSPDQAVDPGLVYDACPDDYVVFLCGLRYTARQIAAVTGRRTPGCGAGASLDDLNYPSFMVVLNRTSSATRMFKRVLTNVAAAPAKYSVAVTAPAGMKVTVKPEALVRRQGQQAVVHGHGAGQPGETELR
ncbi:hypothetical protein PR202_ga20326 [Eleusine coracana subsp. coracana]|uniref:Uncharacterized protein n=1 Tax=Eleusine coracana subsp. coracana TaxID=191504 RepID=A0AAV5CXZ2_ELECO|nr:hypothetical protein PR202_ga20326 [Eleusine coracana subsp. coracana]